LTWHRRAQRPGQNAPRRVLPTVCSIVKPGLHEPYLADSPVNPVPAPSRRRSVVPSATPTGLYPLDDPPALIGNRGLPTKRLRHAEVWRGLKTSALRRKRASHLIATVVGHCRHWFVGQSLRRVKSTSDSRYACAFCPENSPCQSALHQKTRPKTSCMLLFYITYILLARGSAEAATAISRSNPLTAVNRLYTPSEKPLMETGPKNITACIY
jgi:hypothetical protein